MSGRYGFVLYRISVLCASAYIGSSESVINATINGCEIVLSKPIEAECWHRRMAGVRLAQTHAAGPYPWPSSLVPTGTDQKFIAARMSPHYESLLITLWSYGRKLVTA